MSNEFKRSNYHRRKKELFNHYKVLIKLIHEGRRREDGKEKDTVNINFRERLHELYLNQYRTGFLNSRNIEDTITTMEKIGLITREKRGKQEKIIKLTPIGDDIYLFICNLEEYNKSYFELLDSLNKKLLFIPSNLLEFMNLNDKDFNYFDLVFKENVRNYKKQLIRHGWDKTEVIFYNEIRSNLIDLKVVCDRTFFNIVLLRYAKIKTKNQITHSLILKFFEHLIKESIKKKIEFILSNFDNEVSGYSNIRVISPINTDLV